MNRGKLIFFFMLLAFSITKGMAAVDPREELLNRANKLAINSVASDGSTTVDSLLTELRTGGDKPATLGKVDSLRFGSAAKTLQQEVDDRLALHQGPTGKFAEPGMAGSDEKIGAFHKALQKAEKKGATKGSAGGSPGAMAFVKDILGLYQDGVLNDGGGKINVGTISADLAKGLPTIIDDLSELGVIITELQAEVIRLIEEQKKEEAKRGAALGGSSTAVDEGMGLFD